MFGPLSGRNGEIDSPILKTRGRQQDSSQRVKSPPILIRGLCVPDRLGGRVTFQELIPYGALVTGILLIMMGARGFTSAFQGSMKTRLARIAVWTPLVIVGTLGPVDIHV